MTPEQQAICEYLVTYRNPDGSLLLPQFGGCWHEWDYQAKNIGGEWYYVCKKCGHTSATVRHDIDWRSYFDDPPKDGVNLFTWPNFGILWEAMQAREDFDWFLDSVTERVIFAPESSGRNLTWKYIFNPLTFPATVEAYLKGLENPRKID